MAAVRAYVPSTLGRLADVLTTGGLGPGPFLAHAVTESLRSAFADGTEEEWEYAALTAAAQASITLLSETDLPLRVVVAVDTPVAPRESEDPTQVEVTEVVPIRRIAAIHVDSDDAADDVAAARAALVRAATAGPASADAPDADADAALERCLEHELGWYAAQELPRLLDTPS